MDQITARLTVFFEEPFWVAVYERNCGGKLEAGKITFGTEPKDYEIYAFFMAQQNRMEYGPPIPVKKESAAPRNPKRRQREISRALGGSGVGTKAQQALKLKQEESKTERKILSKKRKDDEKDRLFELKQQKRKEKHKGR